MMNTEENSFPVLSIPKGAAEWRQGADTCVLDVSVGCKNNPSVKREKPGYVSRIVPKGSEDATTEQMIQNAFPEMVKNGLLCVSEDQCTPKFESYRNLREAKYTSGPCSKITKEYQDAGKKNLYTIHQGNVEDKYVNLITKKYDGSFADYLKSKSSTTILEAFKVLRGVMNAAVALVPDNSPSWVIHGDLHQGNILYKASGGPDGGEYTAIADWGRSILIPNINKPQEVYDILNKYKFGFDQFAEGNGYAQLPFFVMNKINLFLQNPNDQSYEDAVDVLRVWNVAGIVNGLGINADNEFGILDGYKGLEYTYSQKDLITKINTYLSNWSPEFANYIDLQGYAFKQYTPPPPPQAQRTYEFIHPSASFNLNGEHFAAMPRQPQPKWPGTGAYRRGGKAKRTRKQKKTLKKKQRKHTRR